MSEERILFVGNINKSFSQQSYIDISVEICLNINTLEKFDKNIDQVSNSVGSVQMSHKSEIEL